MNLCFTGRGLNILLGLTVSNNTKLLLVIFINMFMYVLCFLHASVNHGVPQGYMFEKYILLYILNLSFQIQIIFVFEYLMDQLHTHFLTPGGIMLDTSNDVRNPNITRMCLLIPTYLYPLTFTCTVSPKIGSFPSQVDAIVHEAVPSHDFPQMHNAAILVIK